MTFKGREFSAAAIVAVGLGLVMGSASAEDLVVATFCGSFAKETENCHVSIFTKATGAKAILTFGSSVQQAAKIRATKGNPEIDVAYMDISIAKQVKAEGLLEILDFAALPSYAEVAKQAFDPEFANRRDCQHRQGRARDDGGRH